MREYNKDGTHTSPDHHHHHLLLLGACSNSSDIEQAVPETLNPTESSSPPLQVRSAMKGGRRKQGVERKGKLCVTWAPDVYDPSPTSVSHAIVNARTCTSSTSCAKATRKKKKKKKKKSGQVRSENSEHKRGCKKSMGTATCVF